MLKKTSVDEETSGHLRYITGVDGLVVFQGNMNPGKQQYVHRNGENVGFGISSTLITG